MNPDNRQAEPDTNDPVGQIAEIVGAAVAPLHAAGAAKKSKPVRQESQAHATNGTSTPPGAPPADPPPPCVKAIWPWGFEMTEAGLIFAPPGADGAPPPSSTWLAGPIEVVGLSRNEEGGAWGKVITFSDPDDIEKIETIYAAHLAGDGAAVRQALLDAGLAISGRKAAKDKLVEALAGVTIASRVRLRDRVGWGLDGTFYAMPAETFGGAERIVLEGQAKGANFGQAGTLADWRAWIAEFVEPHDTLSFFLALAFVGPLLEPIGVDGGGFHLVGPSSCGKSTALAVAASVWGGPTFAQSWRATANALEGVAAAHNDALLCLDEIGICAPGDVGIAAYVLSGGAGKQRMRSDGDLKALRRWRIAVASTGEIGLADKVSEDGRHRPMAGQEIRLVDIRIDPSKTSGVFDDEAPPEYFDRLARTIKAKTATAYGTAGPAFVAALVTNRDNLTTDARKTITSFVQSCVPPGADGQVARVAARFGLVAAAGELATRLAILPFKSGRSTEAARRLFEAWIAARGGTGSTEDRQAIQRVRDFIAIHGSARFQRLVRMGDDQTSGPMNDESWRAQMQAGYRTSDIWYFHDAGFKEALDGLDSRAAADALYRRDLLVRDGPHRRMKVRTPRGRQRLFAVKNDILEFDDEGTSS